MQKAANKAVGTAIGALAINAVWAEAISFLMAMWKNKGKKYRDEEDELTAGSILMEAGKNILGSFAGTVAGGEEIFEVIGNIVSGDKWYGIDVPGVEAMVDVVETMMEAGSGMREIVAGGYNVVKNDGDLGEYLRKNRGAILGEAKNVAETMCMYFGGLPVGNVESYLMGMLKWISPELGAGYDDLFDNVTKSDLSGLKGDALTARVGRILEDRKASDSDETAEILAELYGRGYRGVIPSNTPASVSVNGEERKLNAYQQQFYEAVWGKTVAEGLDELVQSEEFQDAAPKTQEKMVSYLYTYAGELAKGELFDDYEAETRDEAVAAFNDAGMSMADFLYVYGKYSEIYSKDMNATAKATEFAHWINGEDFTKEQAAVIKEELSYFNMSPATSSKYDKMVAAGMEPEDAYELVNEIADLEPIEGEERVTNVQEWRTCVKFSTNEGVQLSALAGKMTPEQFAKCQMAYNFGVTPDHYVGYYEIRADYDKDGNGSYSGAEVKAAIDSMRGLSKKEKAVLWQLATGSKSPKNNPYDKQMGQKVIDARNKE